MALIDCFVELIAYVSYLTRAQPAEQPGYERVRGDIEGLIASSGECARRNQVSTGDYDLAQFGVFAWIDETILGSSWQDKQRWQGEQLQRTYYQTADAGEQFFDKLNELQPHQIEVREVYYVCLALGFTGRYCNPGDEFLLGQLKGSNLKLLEGGTATTQELVNTKLFPSAYPDGKTPKLGGGRKFFSVATIIGGSAPVVLFVLLFFVYRFVLSNVGENLIRSIR